MKQAQSDEHAQVGVPSTLSRDVLADRWRKSLVAVNYSVQSAAELRRSLQDLVDRALAVLETPDPATDEVHSELVGKELVRLGFTSPHALGVTQQLLLHDLPACLEGPIDDVERRLGILLGGIANGFAAAARERLLAEQEASLAAVLTENRRAVEAVRQQAALLDLAPDAILVRDFSSGRILFWNQGAVSLFGWGQKEALGQPADRLLQTVFPAPLADLQMLLTREGRWEGEVVHTRNDGSTVIVTSRWALQRHPDGSPLSILQIDTDISARKRIEAELRDREANLESAQEIAHLGSWEWNLLTNTAYWSAEAYRLLGYSQAEIDPSLDAFLEAVHPEDRARVRQAVEDAFAGNSYVFEHRTSALDGVERVLQSRSAVQRDSSGRPERMVGTALDITVRKRAEAERAQLLVEQAARAEAEAAKQRLGLLADVSRQLAASLDYDATLQTVARVFVSQIADVCTVDMVEGDGRICRLAVARAPAERRELEMAWPAPPDVQTAHPLAESIRDGKPVLRGGLGPDGADAMVVPLRGRGRVLGAITCLGNPTRVSYTDVDLALAEEVANRCGLALDNARLHAEAQQAKRLRDEFLSVAAHELKTPMTTLRGYTQLLLRRAGDKQAVEPVLLARGLESIDAQSRKLVYLTEQLLDVSRIEAGKLRLELRSVDLVNLVTDVVHGIQGTTGRRFIELDLPATAPVRVDAIRFEQVISNLVGNAVKYSPDDSQVDVSLREAEDGIVELSVRDRGLGIPSERRTDLFDRFYQAHGEGHFGGLGLGLYVSRQIVELHGGHIEAQFPLDGGCRFVVTLPSKT